MSTDDLHLPSDQMDLLEEPAPWDREEEGEEQESEDDTKTKEAAMPGGRS